MQVTTQNTARPPSFKAVTATVIGNALEFYDFVTYAFFAVYIGKTFFPANDPMTSLLLSVVVFGVGFFSRPLGGILIGAYADRAGRKPALLLTIALITIGTIGVAATPSYASIGITAPIIVVVARLIQGLGLGGEVGPSSAFLIESAPNGKRGTYGSWLLGSQGAATLVAGGIGVGLSSILSVDELQAWGWRIPFLMGLLIIPVALYLRKNMDETLHHTPATPRHDVVSPAASYSKMRLYVGGTLAILGGTVATYLGNYMTTYAISQLKFPPTIALKATVVVGLATLLFALVGGILSDKVGRKITMLWPRILAVFLVVPLFSWLISDKSAFALYTVTFILATTTAISGAATLIAIPEMFPRKGRALAMSIIYAIGVAIFGGSTQAVVTWLIQVTGDPLAPAWYVAVTSVLCAMGMMMLPETKSDHLEH